MVMMHADDGENASEGDIAGAYDKMQVVNVQVVVSSFTQTYTRPPCRRCSSPWTSAQSAPSRSPAPPPPPALAPPSAPAPAPPPLLHLHLLHHQHHAPAPCTGEVQHGQEDLGHLQNLQDPPGGLPPSSTPLFSFTSSSSRSGKGKRRPPVLESPTPMKLFSFWCWATFVYLSTPSDPHPTITPPSSPPLHLAVSLGTSSLNRGR